MLLLPGKLFSSYDSASGCSNEKSRRYGHRHASKSFPAQLQRKRVSGSYPIPCHYRVILYSHHATIDMPRSHPSSVFCSRIKYGFELKWLPSYTYLATIVCNRNFFVCNFFAFFENLPYAAGYNIRLLL